MGRWRDQKRLTLRDLRRLAARGVQLCTIGGSSRSSDPAVPPRRYVELYAWPRAIGAPRCQVLKEDWDLCGPTVYEAIEPCHIDRLIARLGPHWTGYDQWDTCEPYRPPQSREEGESRPKGTDEVSPSEGGSDDAATHGGDGNSGEVDAPAQTSSTEAREGTECSANEGSADAGAERGGQDGGNPEPPHASTAPAPAGEATADGPQTDAGANPEAPGELTAEPGQPTQAAPTEPGELSSGEGTESASSDAPGRDALGRDGDGENLAPAETTAATSEPALTAQAGNPEGLPVTEGDKGCAEAQEADFATGDTPPPHSEGVPHAPLEDQHWEPVVRSSLASHGGTFSDAARADLLARAEGRAAREVRRALERLLRSIDLGGLEDSPRLSGSRLVRELVGRRYNVARARRRELTVPLVVLACDVSGSCSAVCTETLAACLAVAEAMEGDVAVIQHSNGHLITHDGEGSERLAEWCRKWSRQQGRPIGAVVAFGDWDAGDDYQQLCESGASLIWLDSYCCSVTGVKQASKTLREGAREWKRQPLAWFQGVNDAKSAAIALRAAIKGGQQK